MHIAVGGKASFYYLPLTIAEQLGYFKDEGLNVKISDFAGGSQALRAVVGGSADVVSGAYEHTINMQAKSQMLQCFVQQGRAPQISIGIATAKAKNYKSPKDLKGMKIGVSAPGSSTHMVVNYFIGRDGLKPADVSIIGVGLGATAITALKSGQIDAISNTDPVMMKLEQDGDVKIIADTRTLKGTEQVFGGPMPAACLYAPVDYIRKNPNTVQALTNAIVRADKWIYAASPAGRAANRARGISARRQGAVSVFIQQGEGSDLSRRLHLRGRREDRAQGPADIQPRGEAGRDQARTHIYQRVRKESEREVQVTAVDDAVISPKAAIQ